MLSRLLDLHRFFANHPLSSDAPLGAWRRFAQWQVNSRRQEEMIVPWIGGCRLAVRRGMKGATGNIYVGLHEFEDMGFLIHFLREGDLFLDIGANVGSYTVLASGLCRAFTSAFEPDPTTVVRLRRNIEINRLDKLVSVHECALGPQEGEITFTNGLDTVNKVVAAQDAGRNGARLVRQRRLDDVVGDAEPAMIKMDVEGYEDAVLEGAMATLRKPSLRAIEAETVSPVFHEALRACGFETARYDPLTRRLESGAGSSSNTLYIRDRDFVAARLTGAPTRKVLNRSI